jgi:hypothetical protein
MSPKQLDYLFSLKDKNTFTITTGHQLNLFTGRFCLYKILQTIKTAEFLKSNFPEHNFVPVFGWRRKTTILMKSIISKRVNIITKSKGMLVAMLEISKSMILFYSGI